MMMLLLLALTILPFQTSFFIHQRFLPKPNRYQLSTSNQINFSELTSSTSLSFHKLLQDCAIKGDPVKAESIIEQMKVQEIDFTIETYEYLIRAWINSHDIDPLIVASEIDILLDSVLNTKESLQGNVFVDILTFFGDVKLPIMAEKITYKLLSSDLGRIEYLNLALRAWILSESLDNAVRSEALATRYAEYGHNLSRESYELLIDSWTSSNNINNDSERSMKVYELLLRMIADSHIPTQEIYEKVVILLSEEGRFPGPSKQVTDISLSMEMFNITLSRNCYIQCILKWARTKKTESPRAISKIIAVMRVLNYEKSDITSLHCLAWATSGISDAVFRATESLLELRYNNDPLFYTLQSVVASKWAINGFPDLAELIMTMKMSNNNTIRLEDKTIDVTQSSDLTNQIRQLVLAEPQCNQPAIQHWNNIISAHGRSDEAVAERAKMGLLSAYQYLYNYTYGSEPTSSLSNLTRTEGYMVTFLDEYMVNNIDALGAISSVSSVQPVTSASGEFSVLIDTSIDRSRVSGAVKAERLYKKLDSLSIQPDMWTRYSMIVMWCELGYPLRAEDILNQALVGIKADEGQIASSYEFILLNNALIQGWLKFRRNLSADSMAETDRIDIRISTLFLTICREYSGSNISDSRNTGVDSITILRETYDELMKMSVPLSYESHKSFLLVLSQSEETVADDVSDYFESIRQFRFQRNAGISKSSPTVAGSPPTGSGIPSFELNQRILNADVAVQVFQRMFKQGLLPDIKCYELLFKVFENSSPSIYWIPDKALEIVRNMKEIGIEPSVDLYIQLLRLWTRSERADAARMSEGVFRVVLRSLLPQQPPLVAFNLLLGSWSRSVLPNAMNKAMEVVETMTQSNTTYSVETYSILSQGLYESFKRFMEQTSLPINVEEEESRLNSGSKLVKEQELLLSSCLNSNMMPPSQLVTNLIESWALIGSSVALEKARWILIIWTVLGDVESVDNNTLQKLQQICHSLLHSEMTPLTDSEISSRVINIATQCDELSTTAFTMPQSALTSLVKAWMRVSSQRLQCVLTEAFLIFGGMKISHEKMLPLFNFLLAYYSETSFDSRVSSLPAPDRLIRALIPWKDLEKVNRIFPPLLDVDLTELKIFKDGIEPVGTITSVNLFLKLLTNSIAGYAKKELLNKPDAILAELPLSTIVPNDDTFFMMVKYWKYVLPTCAQGATERDEVLASKAQALFEMMIQGNGNPITITAISEKRMICSALVFSSLLELWTKVDAYQAVDTIELMMKVGYTPSAQDFALVIKSLIDINRLNECELLLNLHFTAVTDLRTPDPTCCNLVLEAFATPKAARSLRDDPGERATKLISRIVASGGKVSSNMAMQAMMAWSRSRSPLSARKAEQFLRSSLASGTQPLHQHFNKLLDIYGKVDLRNTTLKSEVILLWMRDLELEPNLVTYNSVLSAWGRSNDPLAEERAFAIFDKVLEQGLQPDIITYTSLLSAISRSRDPNAPIRADDIFEQMLHDHINPDIIAYSILISVWSKSFRRDKEDRVLEIYESMTNNDIKPNEVTYTTMLSMWGASKHPKARANVMRIFKEMTDSSIGLDLVGYSSLLTAISRSRDENSPYRADEVFSQMTATGIQPDVIAYSILLNIWSRSWVRGKEKKVHEIYLRMLADGVQPSTQTYTTLLNCWANCKHSQAKARINEIYDRLCHEVIDLDGRAYDALLMALKRASSQPLKPTDDASNNSNTGSNGLVSLPKEADYVGRAESLLLRSLDFGLSPSMQCWAKVISADPSAYQAYPRALRLYSTLLREGTSPDAEVISAVLVVLAYASKYEVKAVEVASAILFKYVESTTMSTTGREVSIPLFNMYLNVIVNANADLDLKLKLAVVSAERLWPTQVQANRSSDAKGEDELVHRNTRGLYQSLLDEYKRFRAVAVGGDVDSYVDRIEKFIEDRSRFIERNTIENT